MYKGIELLDHIYSEITGGDAPVHDVMEELFCGLRDIRLQMAVEDWEHFSRSLLLHHPSLNLFHQDPFTRRSFEKPRGYDGDAKLLDFIYGYNDLAEYDVTELGKKIYDYTTNSPASRSVRMRRETIAKTIDAQAKEKDMPRIFSLACGHLREGHVSQAIQEKRIKELVAMDYDKKSLAVVNDEFSQLNVKTVHGSIRDLILSRKFNKLGMFDFVYVSGLYDYLSQRVATRLTTKLFSMLNPGGRLMVSNFLPHIKDVGYMETFMDWRLIYRDESQLLDIAANIPPKQVKDAKTFIDENENIVFLRIIKAV